MYEMRGLPSCNHFLISAASYLPPAKLSQCHLLGVPAIGCSYDVDSCYGDIGLDGLAGLDVEGGDALSADTEDADIGTMTERRGGNELARTGGEGQFTGELTCGRVVIVTDIER